MGHVSEEVEALTATGRLTLSIGVSRGGRDMASSSSIAIISQRPSRGSLPWRKQQEGRGSGSQNGDEGGRRALARSVTVRKSWSSDVEGPMRPRDYFVCGVRITIGDGRRTLRRSLWRLMQPYSGERRWNKCRAQHCLERRADELLEASDRGCRNCR